MSLRAGYYLPPFIIRSPRRTSLRLLLIGLFIWLAVSISSFALTGTANADGSGGPGGGAGSCTGAGPCTSDGWAWAKFVPGAAGGPSYEFSNGTDMSDGSSTNNWGIANSQCKKDGAEYIFAFVILDSSTGQTGIYSFTPGLSTDSGGPEITSSPVDTHSNSGILTTIGYAYKEFQAFKTNAQFSGQAASLVWPSETSDSNVGWFCGNLPNPQSTQDADAHSTVTPTSLGLNQPATFQHWVNTTGTSSANSAGWDYRVEGCYINASNGSCNWSTNGCGNQTSNCPTLKNANGITTANNYDSGTNGDTPPDINDARNAPPGGLTYSFPSSAVNGDKYCQRLEINPDSSTNDDNMDGNNTDDGTWYSDNGSCVTYSYTPHTPDADAHSVVSPGIIGKGVSTTFQHWVNTTNASSSTNAGWQYRVEGCFVQSGNATGNPSDCSSSWSTTGCGSQQPGCPTLANATGIRTANNYDSSSPPALGDTRDNPANGIKYSFPSSAKSGDEYCQRLEISVDTVTIDNDMDGNNHSDGSWYTDNGTCVTYNPKGSTTPPTYAAACNTGVVTFTVPGSTTNPSQGFVGVSGTQSGITVSDSTGNAARTPIPYTSTSQTSQPPGNPGSPYTYIIRINSAGNNQNITVTFTPGTTIVVSILVRAATSPAATSFSPPSLDISNSYTCDTAPTASLSPTCDGDTLTYSFDDVDDSSAAVATITATTAQHGTQTIGRVTGGSSGSIDTSQYVGFQSTTYTITVPDILRNGAPGGLGTATASQSITCPPLQTHTPPQMSCGGLGGVGGDDEAGTSFNLSFSVGYNIGAYGSGPTFPTDYMTVTSSLPGGTNGDVDPVSTNSLATGSVTIGASADAGTYLVTWTFNDGSGPLISCSASLTLYNYPYVNFFGGDVTAGGGFGTTSCNDTSLGNIYTYLNSTDPSEGGSGNQFGVEALNVIEGMRSASLNGTTSYSDLSFANSGSAAPTGSSPIQQFGGSYGVQNNCVPDYYADKPSNATNPFGGTLPATPGQVAYSNTGTLTINSLSVANGVNAGIYVNGNVYIDGDITYAGSGSGSWTNVSDIPSLYIVATGNIFIAPNVKTLDGVYVAEPSGLNTGVINTCASSTAGIQPSTDASYYAECQNQLTVNGAFVAQNIFLDRSYSSLRYSKNGESPEGASHTCGTAGVDVPSGSTTAPDCAAEIFNFSPEIYLSQPASNPTSGPASYKYDYITTLPPVF